MRFYDNWASLQIIYSLYYGHSLVVCMTQLLAKELTGFSLPDKHMNEEYPYVEQNCRYNYCYCSPSPISGFLEGDVIDRQDIWATISQREKQDGTQLIRSVIQVTVKNERFIMKSEVYQLFQYQEKIVHHISSIPILCTALISRKKKAQRGEKLQLGTFKS